MRVYICTKFKGYYPVGAAAIAVAPSKSMAVRLLEAELAKVGLPQTLERSWVEEVDTATMAANVLVTGDY